MTNLLRKHGCPKCPLAAFCLVRSPQDDSILPVGIAACDRCKNVKLLLLQGATPVHEYVYVWMEAALTARIPINCKHDRTFMRPVCPACGLGLGHDTAVWDGPILRVHT